MSVCYKEGIKMSSNALAEIIMASGQDVRQVLYAVSTLQLVVDLICVCGLLEAVLCVETAYIVLQRKKGVCWSEKAQSQSCNYTE